MTAEIDVPRAEITVSRNKTAALGHEVYLKMIPFRKDFSPEEIEALTSRTEVIRAFGRIVRGLVSGINAFEQSAPVFGRNAYAVVPDFEDGAL